MRAAARSIPWITMPLKAAALLNTDVLQEGTDPDWIMRYVDIGGVDQELGIHSFDEMTFVDAPSRARRMVRDGDVILSTVRTYLRAVAPIREPEDNLIVSTGFAVVRPRDRVDPRFLAYALQSSTFINRVVASSVGVSYPAIAPSVIAGLPLQVPVRRDDQVRIADLLDAEIARLKEAKADYEDVVRLARERALAIASNAIAEVSANAPMVELRRVLRKIEQGWSPQAEERPREPDEWGVLKLSAIRRGVFQRAEHKALPATLLPRARCEVHDGDLLLTRANTQQLVGDACIVRDPPARLMMSDLIYRLVPNLRHADPEYLCMWLLTAHARQQIEADARGTSLSMVKVSQELVGRWLLPLPDLDVQRRIVRHVRAARADVDAVIEPAMAAIALIGAKRTATITQAVGAHDLRTDTASKAA